MPHDDKSATLAYILQGSLPNTGVLGFGKSLIGDEDRGRCRLFRKQTDGRRRRLDPLEMRPQGELV
jgi:hypothetical protein